MSGSKSLASFTNRTFHLSCPPGFRRAFDAAERNGRYGCIQCQRGKESSSRGKRKRRVFLCRKTVGVKVSLVLLRHARRVPSRLRCKEHSLLVSFYQFIIGKIENPYCSACRHSSQDTSPTLSSYGLFAPLALWRLSDSLRPLVQTLKSFPASGAR